MHLFSGLPKFFRQQGASIDGVTAKLYYRVTSCLFVAGAILLLSYGYLGTPMRCHSTSNTVSDDYLTAYCFSSGTFIHRSLMSGIVGVHSSSPGVGPANIWSEEDKVKLDLYMWFPVVLLFQALLSCLPRFLWKFWEGGQQHLLSKTFEVDRLLAPQELRLRAQVAVWVIRRQIRLKSNQLLPAWYMLTEALYPFLMLVQLALTYHAIGQNFPQLYSELATAGLEAHTLKLYFPKVSKCYYLFFGPSGSISSIDASCLLAYNSVASKVWLGTGVWCHFVVCLSAITLVVKALIIMTPPLRAAIFYRKCVGIRRKDVYGFLTKATTGDWLVLVQLERNIPRYVYQEIMSLLILEEEPEHPYSRARQDCRNDRYQEEQYQPDDQWGDEADEGDDVQDV